MAEDAREEKKRKEDEEKHARAIAEATKHAEDEAAVAQAKTQQHEEDAAAKRLQEMQQADQKAREQGQVNERKRLTELAAEQKAREARLNEPLTQHQLAIQELAEVNDRYLGRYMSSPFGGLRPREQRKGPALFHRLSSIPLIGGILTPSNWDKVANVAQLGASVYGAMPLGFVVGGTMRGIVDGLRWAVGREVTADILAREYVRRGTDSGRSVNQRTAWAVAFGDPGDFQQFDSLAKQMQGIPVDEWKLGEVQTKRLIRIAMGAHLDAQAFDRLLPGGADQYLTESERTHLKRINQAVPIAEQLFTTLDDKQQENFIKTELPAYLERRELTNHLKLMAIRSPVAGLKTAFVAGAATLFKGVGYLVKDGGWGKTIGDAAARSLQQLGDSAGKWVEAAKDGLTTFWNGLPNFPSLPNSFGAGVPGSMQGIPQAIPGHGP